MLLAVGGPLSFYILDELLLLLNLALRPPKSVLLNLLSQKLYFLGVLSGLLVLDRPYVLCLILTDLQVVLQPLVFF